MAISVVVRTLSITWRIFIVLLRLFSLLAFEESSTRFYMNQGPFQ